MIGETDDCLTQPITIRVSYKKRWEHGIPPYKIQKNKIQKIIVHIIIKF